VAHILPCYVHHEGPVNASERFWAPHILRPENDSESGENGELFLPMRRKTCKEKIVFKKKDEQNHLYKST
jgi:hypothetical protein